jgi:LAO/AO transport system kinase
MNRLSSLQDAVISGDRTALARAITLIESTRDDHQQEAQALLSGLLPQTGRSIRLGITGVPGVGKSSFIETFGLHVIGEGHKVAVLAVDPSSVRTGGSILGDKTRMSRLSQDERAYIRPSPTGGSLGGVARRTREAMLLCEAAGYDVVIVETVGVGQSETEVSDMVDMFLLMLLPGSGDELQGIKKGIVELADLIVVNKADGDLVAQARRVRADYSAALRMLHPPLKSPPQAGGIEKKIQFPPPAGGIHHSSISPPPAGGIHHSSISPPPAGGMEGGHWQPKAITCSALLNQGISEVWQEVESFARIMRGSGELDAGRSRQAVSWMWKEIREMLMQRFRDHASVASQILRMEQAVQQGSMTPTQAGRALLDSFGKAA